MTLQEAKGKKVVTSEQLAGALNRPHFQVLSGIDKLLYVATRDGEIFDDDILEGEKPNDAPGPKRCYFLTERGALAYAERLRGPQRPALRKKIEMAFKSERA